MATPARTKNVKSVRDKAAPLEEQIRRRAHDIYLQRGGQDGSDWDDWLQAEQELINEQNPRTSRATE